jgi:hypothetical protein
VAVVLANQTTHDREAFNQLRMLVLTQEHVLCPKCVL